MGNPKNEWLTALKQFLFTLLDPSGKKLCVSTTHSIYFCCNLDDKQIDEDEYAEVLSMFGQSAVGAKENYRKLIAASSFLQGQLELAVHSFLLFREAGRAPSMPVCLRLFGTNTSLQQILLHLGTACSVRVSETLRHFAPF